MKCIYVFSYAQSNERGYVLDILPTIERLQAELFVRETEELEEKYNWTLYLHPFSQNTWLLIFLTGVIVSICITYAERFTSPKGQKQSFAVSSFENMAIILKGTFGGGTRKLFEIKNVGKWILYSSLLMGTILWMSYKASFTSELSIFHEKMAFYDLFSLLKTDYR